MNSSRFTRLIAYLKEQEDQVRSELGQVDAAIRGVEGDIAKVDFELSEASQFGSLQQRQQLLTFSAHCADQRAVYDHQMQHHREQRAAIQERLLVLWRRRRSLETLEQRERETVIARKERQENDDILEGAVRAWNLLNAEQAQEAVQTFDSEVVS